MSKIGHNRIYSIAIPFVFWQDAKMGIFFLYHRWA